jgi:hypothetical protein
MTCNIGFNCYSVILVYVLVSFCVSVVCEFVAGSDRFYRAMLLVVFWHVLSIHIVIVGVPSGVET